MLSTWVVLNIRTKLETDLNYISIRRPRNHPGLITICLFLGFDWRLNPPQRERIYMFWEKYVRSIFILSKSLYGITADAGCGRTAQTVDVFVPRMRVRYRPGILAQTTLSETHWWETLLVSVLFLPLCSEGESQRTRKESSLYWTTYDYRRLHQPHMKGEGRSCWWIHPFCSTLNVWWSNVR